MDEQPIASAGRMGVAGTIQAERIGPDGVREITAFELHSVSLLPDDTPATLRLVPAEGEPLDVGGFTLRQVRRGEITFIEVPSDQYDLDMLPRIIEAIHMAMEALWQDQPPAPETPPVLVLVPGVRVLVCVPGPAALSVGFVPAEEP